MVAADKFRVLLLDTKRQNPNHYICLAIQKALQKNPNVDLVIKTDLDKALPVAIANQCNLFFAFDGEELNRTICLRLASVCKLSILWVTEDPYELNVNLENSDIFDIVFTNDSASVQFYGEKGRHLPLAGATDFHFLPVKQDVDTLRYDIFFAGTAWPNRVALFNDLFSGDFQKFKINSKIALPTNQHLPQFNLNVPLSQIDWRTSPLDFARFANTSIATLLLPRVFSASGNTEFAETPPPRLYEAALAGTVQLVQSNLNEVESYFTEGEDFLYFNTAQDLVEKLLLLRTNLSWRNQIAVSAQKKALELHCYENRVNSILAELDAYKLTVSSDQISQSIVTSKTKLMFVAHNVVENGGFGGVEVYLKMISLQLLSDYEIYFYVPDYNDKKSTLVISSDGKVLKKYGFQSEASIWQLSCQEREEAFSLALIEYGISVVHFHHLINHVPSLIEIASSLGVSTIFTVHDYFAVCKNFTLISFKNGYCEPDKNGLTKCDICLSAASNVVQGAQSERRSYWDHILQGCDTLVFNTKCSYDLVAEIFPSVSKHQSALVLPVPIARAEVSSKEISEAKHGVLKVAIIGNFEPHKGANIIARVIKFIAQSNSKIEFHIFGRLNEDFGWINDPNIFPFVHVYGSYQAGEIPKEVLSCHLSLHLSVWPETYCLTLSEAWNFGLVPIVSNIGALGERVEHGVNGFKISMDSESELIETLFLLSEKRDLIDSVRAHIHEAPISYLDNHLHELKKLYQRSNESRELLAYVGDVDCHHSLISMGRNTPVYWAEFSKSNQFAQPRRLAFLGRLKNLMIKGLDHFSRYGFWPTTNKAIRYIKGRLL